VADTKEDRSTRDADPRAEQRAGAPTGRPGSSKGSK
jgi:hypothetical protein